MPEAAPCGFFYAEMPQRGGTGGNQVRFKDFEIKEASEEGNGGFTGYAATFDREPDCYGDVIAKGAFTDTLKAWADSGRPVPLLYGHNMEDPDFNIGTAELSEDDTGLLARAAFDSSPKAQRVRELVREGRLAKMSFAFDVRDECPVELDGGIKANELRALDLYEVSVVLVPANSHAEILESKGRKYGMTISKATGDELSAALESIAKIKEEAAKAEEILKALAPEGEDEPDEGQQPDEGGSEEEPKAANSDAKSGEMLDRLVNLIY